MPLYIPWLTETIKKRGVRYLLHHYLGQFFEEKLTLDQLSIDIYEGRGSIRNLALDVDGLNDELDFIPFTFLDGCLIGQISVEVPWSSLVTDACRVELDGAKFFCRLKTTADAAKHHCTESTLLSRSLMTSSMQMAEEIVTTEDDDDVDSIYNQSQAASKSARQEASGAKKKDANQMFEGLEMFAQLIDSVLRRTKLTARNTSFRIQPHNEKEEFDDEQDLCSDIPSRNERNQASSRSSGDEFSEPTAKSDTDDESQHSSKRDNNRAKSNVEFFIKFFRCEEMIDQTKAESDLAPSPSGKSGEENDGANKSLSAIPETITKLLTLEDVEMRIDGVPVSNLIGKHTITIKFNGQKSEISIFSGSPLLAVISHKQLETFFNVFDGSSGHDLLASSMAERNQQPMRPEDYAKIENQLLESAPFRNNLPNDLRVGGGGSGFDIGGNAMMNNKSPYHARMDTSSAASTGRRWAADNGVAYSESHATNKEPEYGYRSANFSAMSSPGSGRSKQPSESNEPTLDHIEAFSCELKLPGIWLCILRAGETLPALIKPYADSINSFQTINKYIDNHIKVPHIRCLALKVALDITAAGTNLFLGDLDISEHLEDSSRMSPVLKLIHNDQSNTPMSSSRYKASIANGKIVSIDLLTKTRAMFDPTIIDRIVYDYKLVGSNPSRNSSSSSSASKHNQQQQQRDHLAGQSSLRRGHSSDLNLTLKGDQFKVELLCPIPDLSADAHKKRTQLRPQSFIFDFKDTTLTWQSDRLTINSQQLVGYVKTQPMQSDTEAVKFIESTSKGSDRIAFTLEPSPSNLDEAFSNDIEQALNESSMYDSIYVSQATESRLPTDPFQTKRKVVRASFQSQQTGGKPEGARKSECDNEKILTPGDRQHLLDYLNQTVMATKLSMNLHLPVCEVEFEDKEQLDLIYNRFGNDFVFWQPRALTKLGDAQASDVRSRDNIRFKQPRKLDDDDDRDDERHHDNDDANDEDEDDDDDDDDQSSSLSDNQLGPQNSFHSMARKVDTSQSERYDNQVTCKIIVDELFVKFNHQSCAAALKQEIAAENLLLGVIIDVNKQPSTLLSLVADNLELSTDLETVLEGNFLGDKNSLFGLTAEIKRPTKLLKDIKLAIQLKNGLFNDFRTETYTRFWQSINVTDEPILGYVAPQIVTELHIDILNTSLLLVRADARPALLSIDELYMTSMVMERTSQVMIRLIADEVSLYMKRDRQGLETMKNYICLIDSGLIDLDVKFGQDDRLEFGVINNVITVRVCQDSLSALCKLFDVLIRNPGQQKVAAAALEKQLDKKMESETRTQTGQPARFAEGKVIRACKTNAQAKAHDQRRRTSASSADSAGTLPRQDDDKEARRKREMNLLADAMNDYSVAPRAGETGGKLAAKPGENEDAGHGRGGHEECEDAKRSNSTEKDRSDEEDEVTAADQQDDYESDSDAPPIFQRAASSSSSSSSSSSGSGLGSASSLSNEGNRRQRDPNACLLDESNPMLGDMFSPPLLPSSGERSCTARPAGSMMNSSVASAANHATLNLECSQSAPGENAASQRAMDESGFFVIGDDDVGAGIIDKKQHEPVVRKLIDGPISIIENHFKMTKPRTIPEMLATSLERYVLEEMTLVVNLFGGRDFDDEEPTPASTNEDASSTTQKSDNIDQASGGAAAAVATTTTTTTSSELLDAMGAEGQQLVRGRAGSVASARRPLSGDLSSVGSPRRMPAGKLGGRRKHLSEGGAGASASEGARGTEPTQRVRFGEGALNLWESLDLMSSPDFLGARPRPSQPPLSSLLKQAGGTWRENDVCIQLTLSKVKLLYEVADVSRGRPASKSPPGSSSNLAAAREPAAETNSTPPISWRFMLFIQDIEVRDRIAASDINRMLYEYCTESMPKRSTQMLAIKNIATINPSDGCEECDLRVSLKPLRLNIDQDTLLFLIEFCTTFSKALTKHRNQQQQQQQQQHSAQPTTALHLSGAASGGNSLASGASPVDSSKQADGGVAGGNVGSHGRAGRPAGQALVGGESGASRGEECANEPTLDARNNRARMVATKRAQESQSLATSTSSSPSRCSTTSSLSAAHKTPAKLSGGQTATSRGGGGGGGACGNFNRNGRDVYNSDTSAAREAIRASGAAASRPAPGRADDGRNNDDARYREDGQERDQDQASNDDDDDDDDYWESSEELEEELEAGDTAASKTTVAAACSAKRPLPTHCHTDDLPSHQPVYIKSFTFSPDVPIRIDYHAKHLDFEQGALAGILMGLAHLDHSELTLRRVQAKHGMRGLDRALLFAINSWLSDIKRNQLPSILGGVGPMHSVIQLFQGMRDLVWMPIDHYRKDGRLVRGLQRGASSFSSSTAMAAINLVNRFISIVQCTVQIAHDIVTPPAALAGHSAASSRRLKVATAAGGGGGQSLGPAASLATGGSSSRRARRHHHHRTHSASQEALLTAHGSAGQGAAAGLNQPRNFCEGVAVGFSILKEGFNDTARNVTVGMQAEDMRSAVGELVRQIPSTLLNPIISATEGAQSVLVGIRNQIAPDARREDQDKWKGRVRGK